MTSIPSAASGRLASIAELEAFSDKARELQLGQAGNHHLWSQANRAIQHVGHAVSTDRMAGRPVGPDDVTVWTIEGGVDVVLVAWFIRLRPDTSEPDPVFAFLITMTPDDYRALGPAMVDSEMIKTAHRLAEEFLNAAGH